MVRSTVRVGRDSGASSTVGIAMFANCMADTVAIFVGRAECCQERMRVRSAEGKDVTGDSGGTEPCA